MFKFFCVVKVRYNIYDNIIHECQYDVNIKRHPLFTPWSHLNNKSIAHNTLFVSYNAENIRLANKSKHNFKRENQVILLINTDAKKWHYLAVKSLSVLFRGITSKHVGDLLFKLFSLI